MHSRTQVKERLHSELGEWAAFVGVSLSWEESEDLIETFVTVLETDLQVLHDLESTCPNCDDEHYN